MNALQKALVTNGLAAAPKEKVKKPRTFTCRKCGGKMYSIPDTNVMACSSCSNFFIFDSNHNPKSKGRDKVA